MSAPAAIKVEDVTGLDGESLAEVLALLHENADMCRRSAEMYGSRAVEDRARGYFASFETSVLTAFRYARIYQATELAAAWVKAVRFESAAQPLAPAHRPTVSVQSACRIAAVTRATLLNWVADGRVECVRGAAGSLRIFVDTLHKSGGQA